MNDGRVQQLAPPQVAYRRPANLFVAGFIGSPSMNFVEGSVENGRFTSRDGEIEVAIPDDRAASATAQTLTLGVRPENVDLHDTPGEYTLSGEVDVVENMGNLQIVYFRAGDDEFMAEVDPDVELETGDEIVVRLNPDKLHLFDGVEPESERLSVD
jgi:multiple sugar transport system ATP-binding protein